MERDGARTKGVWFVYKKKLGQIGSTIANVFTPTLLGKMKKGRSGHGSRGRREKEANRQWPLLPFHIGPVPHAYCILHHPVALLHKIRALIPHNSHRAGTTQGLTTQCTKKGADT